MIGLHLTCSLITYALYAWLIHFAYFNLHVLVHLTSTLYELVHLTLAYMCYWTVFELYVLVPQAGHRQFVFLHVVAFFWIDMLQPCQTRTHGVAKLYCCTTHLGAIEAYCATPHNETHLAHVFLTPFKDISKISPFFVWYYLQKQILEIVLA